jgi:glutamyl-Q tRNA(Asp) synthetase
MEDLDPPREEPGAARRILHSLQSHGLRWDEDVMWQGKRKAAYAAALAELGAAGHLFFCDCTRAMLAPTGACRGRCQGRQAQVATPRAVRVAVPSHCLIHFTDQLQGLVNCHLGEELPDFAVKRKDGLDAYQLAVVVDDDAQGISHVVRGSDLLDSTGRQIFLQQRLGYRVPHYCHLPVITNSEGQKFSKQNHAPALDDQAATANLRTALRFLQQSTPPLELATVEQILAFASYHWALQRVPACLTVPGVSVGA